MQPLLQHSLMDLEANEVFNEKKWIGVGKIYPRKDTPLFMEWAKKAKLAVPPEYKHHFPSATLPVTDFINLKLPYASNELITAKSGSWFSPDCPDSDLTYLFERSIPPKEYVTTLDQAFGQAWFDGAKSIIDPRFNNGTERLPLWILTFWRDMDHVSRSQLTWKRSISWLDKEKTKHINNHNTLAIIDRVKTKLASMGWNNPLSYCSKAVKTMQLSRYLGTIWLTDDEIT